MNEVRVSLKDMREDWRDEYDIERYALETALDKFIQEFPGRHECDAILGCDECNPDWPVIK